MNQLRSIISTCSNSARNVRCMTPVDSDTMWSGMKNGTISFHDLNSGEVKGQAVGKVSQVCCILAVPHTSTVWTGSIDGKIAVWSEETQEIIKVFPGHPSAVTTLVFSENKDGVVYSGSNDFRIKAWSTSTYALVDTIIEHTHQVRCLAICNDFLWSGSDAPHLLVHSLSKKSPPSLQQIHTKSILVLCPVSMNNTIWSGGEDRRICVWDATTFQCLAQWKDSPGPVSMLCHVNQEVWSSCPNQKEILIFNTSVKKSSKTMELLDIKKSTQGVFLLQSSTEDTLWAIYPHDETIWMYDIPQEPLKIDVSRFMERLLRRKMAQSQKEKLIKREKEKQKKIEEQKQNHSPKPHLIPRANSLISSNASRPRAMSNQSPLTTSSNSGSINGGDDDNGRHFFDKVAIIDKNEQLKLSLSQMKIKLNTQEIEKKRMTESLRQLLSENKSLKKRVDGPEESDTSTTKQSESNVIPLEEEHDPANFHNRTKIKSFTPKFRRRTSKSHNLIDDNALQKQMENFVLQLEEERRKRLELAILVDEMKKKTTAAEKRYDLLKRERRLEDRDNRESKELRSEIAGLEKLNFNFKKDVEIWKNKYKIALLGGKGLAEEDDVDNVDDNDLMELIMTLQNELLSMKAIILEELSEKAKFQEDKRLLLQEKEEMLKNHQVDEFKHEQNRKKFVDDVSRLLGELATLETQLLTVQTDLASANRKISLLEEEKETLTTQLLDAKKNLFDHSTRQQEITIQQGVTSEKVLDRLRERKLRILRPGKFEKKRGHVFMNRAMLLRAERTHMNLIEAARKEQEKRKEELMYNIKPEVPSISPQQPNIVVPPQTTNRHRTFSTPVLPNSNNSGSGSASLRKTIFSRNTEQIPNIGFLNAKRKAVSFRNIAYRGTSQKDEFDGSMPPTEIKEGKDIEKEPSKEELGKERRKISVPEEIRMDIKDENKVVNHHSQGKRIVSQKPKKNIVKKKIIRRKKSKHLYNLNSYDIDSILICQRTVRKALTRFHYLRILKAKEMLVQKEKMPSTKVPIRFIGEGVLLCLGTKYLCILFSKGIVLLHIPATRWFANHLENIKSFDCFAFSKFSKVSTQQTDYKNAHLSAEEFLLVNPDKQLLLRAPSATVLNMWIHFINCFVSKEIKEAEEIEKEKKKKEKITESPPQKQPLLLKTLPKNTLLRQQFQRNRSNTLPVKIIPPSSPLSNVFNDGSFF